MTAGGGDTPCSLMPEAGRRWKTAGPLRFHGWGGDHLVYCEASGDTHQIGDEAAEVLAVLAGGEADAAEVLRRLDSVVDGETTPAMEGFLRSLATLGLVEMVGG